jgi:hypothetical protein
MNRVLHSLTVSLATLGLACAPAPSTVDTGSFEGALILLNDEQGAPVRSELEVMLQPVRAGVDVMVDWSQLRHDVWGRPLDPLAETDRVTLLHLRLDLQATLDGLAQGTIPQSAVDLQVGCTSDEARCAFSEFSFAAGHPVDLIERFQPGDGCWLLSVQHSGSGADAAFLALLPVPDAEPTVASIDDRSSARWVDVDLRALPTVELPLGGHPVLDWGDLATSSTGGALEPSQLDLLGIAHLPDSSLDEGSLALLSVGEIADRRWSADTAGRTSLPLSELIDADSGEPGFPLVLAPGTWLLTLHRDSAQQPYPAFVSRLVQHDEQP